MAGKRIRVKAPATVSNLSCGFDVLGLALDEPFDVVDLELTDAGTVVIDDIRGCGRLSRDPEQNVVGVVLKAASAMAGSSTGFRVSIEKGIRPGSGIGSSSASAAAAAFGANLLLGEKFTSSEMVRLAMEGERLASGSAHADNVAPALLGGIILVRSYEPLDIVRLHVPPELYCVVIHPETEIKTSVARGLLDRQVPLTTAVRQWGNLAGLVAGLYREDYDLIGRSLIDFVAEPKRSVLIEGFDLVRSTAMECGALGAGISGSGPSVFALCRGGDSAAAVMKGMSEAMKSQGIGFDAYVSPVSRRGAQVW
ncbi:MAG TPA: homoserine kinase [Bacteroidales bacterium]|nr:homoserine kinase [Bacteroidales bacterium]